MKSKAQEIMFYYIFFTIKIFSNICKVNYTKELTYLLKHCLGSAVGFVVDSDMITIVLESST